MAVTRSAPAVRAGNATRHPSSAASGDMLEVVVVLLEGGFASTAVGPIEVFHSAGVLWNWLHGGAEQPRFRVRVASIDGAGVTSLGALGLTPSCAIADIARADVIVVPASGWDVQDSIARNTPLLAWLRQWHARGAYVAGICSGVVFLAESGLLDGRQATTHWGVADALRRRYPAVQWRPDQFVTDDGRVLCSGGIYAAIDLSLYLVEKFCGHEIALQCAKSLLVSMPRSRQSGYAAVPLSRPHADDKISRIEEYLQAHFAHDLSIDQLAAQVGMGPRNFIRRFKAATGHVPGSYIQMLRVAAAKGLLEHGAASIQAVCTRIGYADAAFFRRVFKRHTGMTPADYRKRFARASLDPVDLAGDRPAA